MNKPYPFITRSISARIKKMFSHFSCVALMGARQVGKSTLLENIFPSLPRIVFDPIHDIQGARADPELFLKNNPPPIILDEIQYAPELIPVIKRYIDEHKQAGMYLLTGSQQWAVLKDIAESLAGRAVLLNLDGFSLAELTEQTDKASWLSRWLTNPDELLDDKPPRLTLPNTAYQQLWRGFLPETHFLDLDLIPTFHSSYQRTYIERDIRLLANVSDLAQFGRFVKLVAGFTAQEINFSQLGREIGITPQTASRWLNALTQTFEWFDIPAYSNNVNKRVSSKPKGYFTDTGQVCHSQMISSPQAIAAHPLYGALFETAVVGEIRKLASLIPTPPQFYHWRAHSGAEIDLLLERDGRFFPIEIKANSQPQKKAAKGIAAFKQQYSHLTIEKGLIIAPTDSIYPVTEDVYVIPWDLK